jgi:FG-GAP-like repeat
VLLGNGDGSFQTAHFFKVGRDPESVAGADVNGDGRPDLVSANYLDNTVSVLLGNGDGSFQRARIYNVGSDPASVAVADVNGDGRPDLVTANKKDNTVAYGSLVFGGGFRERGM